MNARYSLQTLADAAGCSLAELGRRLNISGSTFKQYRDQGMSEVVADRRAAQCGFVAWEVWPEMLEAAKQDAERVEAERRERKREWQRRYRQRPDVQAKKRANDAAYREAARSYLSRQRRLRYEREGEMERQRERERYWANAEEIKRKRRERYWASKRDVKDVA